MIEQLRLVNWQAHKDTTIDFAPGLNVLVGSTDNGKTTVLRAADWLHSGKPVGFNFLSWWAGHGDKAEAHIKYDNGTLSRVKSKSKNTWWVDGKEFNATGKTVPEEAQQLSNWSELNYAGQFDPSFLLSDSDGQVAKKLNALVNLDVIDKTIGNISKEVKRVNSSIDGKKEDKKSLDGQLESYSDLKKAKLAFEKLELTEQKYFDLDDEYHILKDLIGSIDELEGELSQFRDIDDALNEINTLIQKAEEIELLESEKTNLDKALNSVIQKHNELKSYGNVGIALSEIVTLLVDLERIDQLKVAQNGLKCTIQAIVDIEKELEGFGSLEDAHSDVVELLGRRDEIDEKRVEERSLSTQIATIKGLAVDCKVENESLLALEKEFKEAMGDRCPLCDGKIKGD